MPSTKVLQNTAVITVSLYFTSIVANNSWRLTLHARNTGGLCGCYKNVTVYNSLSIDQEDVITLLHEVGSFVQGRVATTTMRPEPLLDNAELEQLTIEALELGLLPAAADEGGFGLWEGCDLAQERAFNIGVLKHLG